MALAAFANLAAAITAGYVETVNIGNDGSYLVMLEKWVTGNGVSGGNIRAYGHRATQVLAEADALANLNVARGQRYGFDTGATSTGANQVAYTRDVM